jgi:hypothetical protein
VNSKVALLGEWVPGFLSSAIRFAPQGPRIELQLKNDQKLVDSNNRTVLGILQAKNEHLGPI